MATKNQLTKLFKEVLAQAKDQFGVDLHKDGWRLDYNSRKRITALCNYKDKVISFSTHFVNGNDIESLRNTMTHEVAHALTPNSGHGAKWKRVHKAMGGTGSRFAHESVISPDPKYVIVYIDEPTVVLAKYHRKPSKSFARSVVKGRPETYGKLICVEYCKKLHK